MFEPYNEQGFPANAFRYRDVPVRFTYRIDVNANHVGEMDIDGLLPGNDKETRIHRLKGPWATQEEALAAAQAWAASWIDDYLAQVQ
ncbi:hypothetical protein SAMN05216189_105335 [Pseudomonas delhiensis]|uniref:Uncharacterized protein n=1 Tax=Pseudomonas delhiensis TaxID=366289 RepID=A0A239NKJ3_9PSED|nr:hypothetical protein [Pseudomonas delhiensis]SDK82687.1 hypothetical protein SAMN05216189_105335 [Pseudomonas delhiensis]SNT55102.1 hypothetical protein SAMN06295949_15021 [Pseudomonas delhiensis]